MQGIVNAIIAAYYAVKSTIAYYYNAFVVLWESTWLYIPRMIWSYIVDFIEWLLVQCGTCGINYTYLTIKNAFQGFQASGIVSYGGFSFSCIQYFFGLIGLDAGFQLIICAYIIRFFIRRIPFFG